MDPILILNRYATEIEQLFYDYDIAELVTPETIVLAAEQIEGFAEDFLEVIEYGEVSNFGGRAKARKEARRAEKEANGTAKSPEEKANTAIGIISSLFGAGMNIWGSVKGAQGEGGGQASTAPPQQAGFNFAGQDDSKKVIFGAIGVSLIVIVVLLVLNMRKK